MSKFPGGPVPLASLVAQVSQEVAVREFCESITFRRNYTASADADTAVLRVNQESLDLEAFKEDVSESTELVAIGGRKDLLEVLRLIGLVKDELNLDLMDGLVFYLDGLKLCYLKLTANDSGSVAIVSINAFHSRLKSAADRKYPMFTARDLMITTVLLVVCAVVVFAKNH